MIEFKNCETHEKALKCLDDWSSKNDKNSGKELIVFSIKARVWYICAYDCAGYLVKGKIQGITYLKTLNRFLENIYKETEESELSNIIDICYFKYNLIFEEIQSALGRSFRGEQEVNFKTLYGDTKNFTSVLIESYYNSAGVLLAAIKDDHFSTLEQRLKKIIPAIFLLRHAIELVLKALLFRMDPQAENPKHDLATAWEKVKEKLKHKNWLNGEDWYRRNDQINHVLTLLKAWGLDKNEDLFRYRDANSQKKVLSDCEPFSLHGVCGRLDEVFCWFHTLLQRLEEEEWRCSYL